MPIYTHQCEACGEFNDVLRSFADCYMPPEGPCGCGIEKWKKIIHSSISVYYAQGRLKGRM